MAVSAPAVGGDYEALAQHFRPVFTAIGEGASTRENGRVLPFEAVAALRDGGFTALTVPQEFGGGGVGLHDWFRLLIDLATADSNVAQLLRAHFIFVEQQMIAPVSPERTRWLTTIASGTILGVAFHERSEATVGSFVTKLTRHEDGGYVLNGVKHYTTGSLFADLIQVVAQDEEDRIATAIVRRDAPGVAVDDDWTGFGQRMTGSGTARFEDVRVEAGDLITGGQEQKHVGPFVEVILQAAAAGVARRAVDDAVAYVQRRTRVYSQGADTLARHDPQVQEVIGRISARAFAAEATVLRAADAVGRARDALVAGPPAEADRPLAEAWLYSEQAQLAVADLVLSVTTELFEVGGASATDEGLRLDRHWRNARTLASHNPRIYRGRQIGDHLLNGESLDILWATGEYSGEKK